VPFESDLLGQRSLSDTRKHGRIFARAFLMWLNTDYVSSLESFLNTDFEFASVNRDRGIEGNIAVARACNGQCEVRFAWLNLLFSLEPK
jgi:hypothetical protein